jgi:hypothetical protein
MSINIKYGEKQTELNYTSLRAGLVKLAVQDYCYDLAFSNKENIKSDIEKLLGLFTFDSKLTEIDITDNDFRGIIIITDEDEKPRVINFHCSINFNMIDS